MTEEIEELKREKVLLLNQFHCADDQGMQEVKQRVAAMDSSLEKLNQQEARYTDELDTALAQYDELRQQAADLYTVELDAARQSIRPNMEREAVQQLQSGYGKRYDAQKLRQSQDDVATMLGKVQQKQSVRQQIRQRQETKSYTNQKRQSQER